MNRLPLLMIAPLAALAGCQSVGDIPTERLGSAALHFANGLPAGTAQLLAVGDGASVTVALAGVSPGTHAVHLHTTGSCQAPDFTSAGGHLNPEHKEHGTQNPKGAHLGDLPNAEIGSNKTGTITARLNGTRQQVLDAIFDSDGTAVVVHAGPDDYVSDPAGNAGGRVACGVFNPA